MKLRDRQIEVFQAIMECGTLTAAAERLCISQPSVSRILSRFEQVSGFKSFELQGRRLVPTEAAKIFYKEVVKIQKGMSHLNNVAEEIRNFRKGYISIGVFPAFSNSWITGIAQEFSINYPHIQLSLLQKSSKDIVEAIEMQRIDLGISLFSSDSEAVSCESFTFLDRACILPSSHPLSKKKSITISDLKKEPYISLINNEQSPLNPLNASENLNSTAYFKTNSASTICHLVANNHGVSIVPTVVAEEHSYLDIVIKPLNESNKKPIYLLKSVNRSYSPTVDIFEKMLLAT